MLPPKVSLMFVMVSMAIIYHRRPAWHPQLARGRVQGQVSAQSLQALQHTGGRNCQGNLPHHKPNLLLI